MKLRFCSAEADGQLRSCSPPNVHSSADSADHMEGAPRKSGEPAEGEGPIPAPQRSLQEQVFLERQQVGLPACETSVKQLYFRTFSVMQ